MVKTKVFEGCGYCKECVRLRVIKAMGREPEIVIECAYKHILDSYSNCPDQQVKGHSTGASTTSSPSTSGSCLSKCRWTSSGWTASNKQSFEYSDYSDWDDYGSLFDRKRVQFVKRKKVR